ncbi:MAG: polyprenyl synthetase family protein [Candidatus Liptonbacteria bacterium]
MERSLFLQTLEEIKPLVAEVIAGYLPYHEPYGHYEMIHEYPRRQGKYFRPGLLIASAELFGARREQALLAAVAMQLSEEWLLVHDDVEDHSETRRRTAKELNPTLNAAYGYELAVNAGDALHILMWKAACDASGILGEEKGSRFLATLNDILITTTEGQFMELSWMREHNLAITENDYFCMVDRKTGLYTVQGPAVLGGIVAGASDEILSGIGKWAILLGRAFQIQDDILDLERDSALTGKERGGDILEGKRTLLLIHLLRSCSSIEREYVSTIYRKPRELKSCADVEYVIGLMEQYGSIEHAREAAGKYAEGAHQEFDRFANIVPDSAKKPEANAVIRSAIEFVVRRNN